MPALEESIIGFDQSPSQRATAPDGWSCEKVRQSKDKCDEIGRRRSGRRKRTDASVEWRKMERRETEEKGGYGETEAQG